MHTHTHTHIKLCFVTFEGLGREAVRAEQPGFVIDGTGTGTIYQPTKWRTWLFSIWLSFDSVCFA